MNTHPIRSKMYTVCLEKVQSVFLYNKNSLCDISVTWQTRRVDWNAHV